MLGLKRFVELLELLGPAKRLQSVSVRLNKGPYLLTSHLNSKGIAKNASLTFWDV